MMAWSWHSLLLSITLHWILPSAREPRDCQCISWILVSSVEMLGSPWGLVLTPSYSPFLPLSCSNFLHFRVSSLPPLPLLSPFCCPLPPLSLIPLLCLFPVFPFASPSWLILPFLQRETKVGTFLLLLCHLAFLPSPTPSGSLSMLQSLPAVTTPVNGIQASWTPSKVVIVYLKDPTLHGCS